MAALPTHVLAQQGDALAEAARLREAGDAERAYALLAALERTQAGNPAFDYALGSAALDAGHHGHAVMALQRVLAVEPSNALARAELARGYAMAGDYDTAKDQFSMVAQDPSLPDPVRQRFNGLVRAYDTHINGGSNWAGFVEANAGHDSNINAATSLSTITIPLFPWLGAGVLSRNSRAIADDFIEMQGGVSWVKGFDRQNRVFVSGIGSLRNNFDSHDFDQAAATLTGGYARTLANRDVLSASLQYQHVSLGHEAFRDAIGAVVQYTHGLSQGRSLTFGGQHFYLDDRSNRAAGAHRSAVAVALNTQRFSLTSSLGKEETADARQDVLSHRFGNVVMVGRVPLTDTLTMLADAGYEQRDYDREEVLFLTRRRDRRVDINAGLRWEVRPKLQLIAKAGWSRNHSNIPLYDYRRTTGTVGIRYEF